jgi:RimJ/RimL family protein N-acetyltransferase
MTISLRAIERIDLVPLKKWRNSPEIMQWCRQYKWLNDWNQEKWYEKINEDSSIEMFIAEQKKASEGFDSDGIPCSSQWKEILGVCGLTSIDLVNRRAEFSCYVTDKGKGNGHLILRELFDFGFYRLGLNSIWGETYCGNPAAKKFDRLGMHKEGTRREFYFRNGKFIDAHIYSVLRSEWDHRHNVRSLDPKKERNPINHPYPDDPE